MDEQGSEPEAAAENHEQQQGHAGPACPACGGQTRFVEGVSTHDLYAEKFVCSSCGRETYRSFGRGSVS